MCFAHEVDRRQLVGPIDGRQRSISLKHGRNGVHGTLQTTINPATREADGIAVEQHWRVIFI